MLVEVVGIGGNDVRWKLRSLDSTALALALPKAQSSVEVTFGGNLNRWKLRSLDITFGGGIELAKPKMKSPNSMETMLVGNKAGSL